MLFEHMVRLDDDHRGGRFEADASLDAADRIAYVHVAADRIARSNGLQRLNRGDPVVVTLTVQRDEFAPLESQRHTTGFGLFQLRRIGLLGQRLAGGKRLLAAYGRTPDTLIDRVFGLLEIEIDSVTAQVLDFLLAAQALLTD